MTEVPVGRAVGRWILNRLSDGAGNRCSACEISAAKFAFQKRVWLKPCDICDGLSFPIVLFVVCIWVKAHKAFLVGDRWAEMGLGLTTTRTRCRHYRHGQECSKVNKQLALAHALLHSDQDDERRRESGWGY